jgi:Tfp pilus assembly protein PilN
MRGRVASFAISSGVVTGRTQAAMSLQAQVQAQQAQQQEIEQIKSAHETLA